MDIKINRSFSSTTRLSYREDDNRLLDVETTNMSAEETIQYARSSGGFRRRSSLTLAGGARYEEGKSNISDETAVSESVFVQITHSPYSYMAWGATAQQTWNLLNDTTGQSGSAYIGFTFPKLTFNTTYFFDNQRSEDGSEVNAHKVVVRLTKKF